MNEAASKLPTKKAETKHFLAEHNLFDLFKSSLLVQLKSRPYYTIASIVIAILVSSLTVYYVDNLRINQSILNDLSSTILGFSVAILGFMTIAFSLLMTITNKKLSLWLFCNEINEYKMPPLKFLLLFFCYPITLYLVSFLVSFAVYSISMLPFSGQFYIHLSVIRLRTFDFIKYYPLINSFALFVMLFSTTLSLIELPSFFSNIYKFIVLYFGKMSEMQEADIIDKMTKDIELDSFEKPFENEINEVADEPDNT